MAMAELPPLRAERLASALETLRLSSLVEEEVRDLYDVAVGCLFYGYFYYPLYTLGTEQLFRVCDAAAKRRCINLGQPAKNFDAAIRVLERRGILDELGAERWHVLRKLRNESTHSSYQTLSPPAPLVGIAERVARDINQLYEGTQRNGPG